jgi:16S rRNA (uracil1498-N3)-methyltransferase
MKHVPRIYVAGRLGSGPQVLEGDAARRLGNVMRVTAGEPLLVFSGDGREWRAEVTGTERGRVHATLFEISRQEAPSATVIEVWIALVRATRMDWAIEKCVEAGADIIRPMLSEHCQRGGAVSATKQERWRRIATEAAEQCGRLFIPPVEAPAPFAKLLDQAHGAVFVADRSGRTWSEAEPFLPPAGHLALVNGPEGGLSDAELAAARARGAVLVSLGPHILRTETAAVVAVGLARSRGR